MTPKSPKIETVLEKCFNTVYIIFFVRGGLLQILNNLEALDSIPRFTDSIPFFLPWTIFTILTILVFCNQIVNKGMHIVGIATVILLAISSLILNDYCDFPIFKGLEIVILDLFILSLTHKPIKRVIKTVFFVRKLTSLLLPILIKIASFSPFLFIVLPN